VDWLHMLRIQRLAIAAATVGLLLALAPSVLACSIGGDGPRPTFATVISEARLVVAVTVVSVPTGGQPGAIVLQVDRVLRGHVSATIEIPEPFASDSCDVATNPGTRLILAMQDPASLSAGLTTAWNLAADGAIGPDGMNAVTDNPTTLDAFIARLAQLPATDTAIVGSSRPSNHPIPVALAALAGAALAWSRFGKRSLSGPALQPRSRRGVLRAGKG
jgi:hypothetical protein